MPTGGAAIMRKGPNLLKLAKKEQCLALTTQLRNKFKFTPCFYRVFPDGTVEYLHPKDGVYPEKVNAGRAGENQNFRRIGENVNPIKVLFLFCCCCCCCWRCCLLCCVRAPRVVVCVRCRGVRRRGARARAHARARPLMMTCPGLRSLLTTSSNKQTN